MNKKLLFFIACLPALHSVSAQIQVGNQIIEHTKFGVQAGFDLAFQSVDANAGFSIDGTKPGGMGGIFVEQPLRYGWYLQPEVNYSMVGTKYYTEGRALPNGTLYKGNVNLALNYISIPLLFKCRNLFDQTGLFIGPQFSYLLSASERPLGHGRERVESGLYKKGDFSGVIGIEAYIPQKNKAKKQVFIGLRGQFGLINIYDGPDPDTKMKNNAFFLTAGVKL